MATGGAWQSETFDNGRDGQKARAPHHAQAPPMGSVTPPMYNPSSVGMNKESSSFGVVALVLRIAQFVLTLIALCVMASNKETVYSYYYSNEYTAEFTAFKAFVGVLSLNCIVCLYAIMQLVHCCINMSTKGSFVSSPTTGFSMLTFIFDTVLAHALIAAAAAGADSAAFFSAADRCSPYPKFCRKAEASVAISFLAFALLAVSAALYPVRLLKLTK